MTFYIDDIEFKTHKNVKQYWFDLNNDTWNFKYYDDNVNDSIEINYILLFENVYNSAFGHWIYDSAIFLEYFDKLNKKFNNKLKIYTIAKPPRKYKKLLFDFFNINNENIIECKEELTGIHRLSRNNKWMEEKNVVLPYNNICITCPIINLNNTNMNTNLFKKRIIRFKNVILDKSSKDKKYIENLFFPRNKKENLKYNDRTINYQPVHKIIGDKPLITYNTLDTNNFIDQINMLINAKNVFLDYGSSLWVNGLFCKNSNIYVSNNLKQHLESFNYYKGFLTLLELIKENNNIIFIS